MGVAQRIGPCIVAFAAGAAMMASPARAQPVPLFPAQVSAANIECLFGSQCTLAPRDETVEIPLAGISGKAVLQARTFLGAPGSTAAGRTAYQYRLDLTEATATADSFCVFGLSIDFGPVEKLPYTAGPTALRDVYEIVQGTPPDQIGFVRVEKDGDVVTFTFARPICAGDAASPGRASFSFGLASLHAPVRGARVQLEIPGLVDFTVKAFGPQR
jgi:hypothetical protein